MKKTYEKDFILSEIIRTTKDNGNVSLGQRKFEELTGVKSSNWRGRYWRNWSEAVLEAGIEPNIVPDKINDETLIHHLALLTRKLGFFPTYSDSLLEKRQDNSFPNVGAFKRLGNKADQIEHVREFALASKKFAGILASLPAPTNEGNKGESEENNLTEGFVYLALMKIGNQKRYKIGKAVLTARRIDQISIQLPEDLTLEHYIKTDDAFGIEKYWHNRFAKQNTKGEWFELSQMDIRAFKNRKFM